MAWGANKFTKKLLRPKAINNNELWDYISRVPDNEELVSFSRIRLSAFRWKEVKTAKEVRGLLILSFTWEIFWNLFLTCIHLNLSATTGSCHRPTRLSPRRRPRKDPRTTMSSSNGLTKKPSLTKNLTNLLHIVTTLIGDGITLLVISSQSNNVFHSKHFSQFIFKSVFLYIPFLCISCRCCYRMNSSESGLLLLNSVMDRWWTMD